jgi:uncharacterized membrane protein YeaQ/YmgE (transglycosylase-associated protein family)
MPLWTFFVWIVIGLIAGVIASNVMGRPGRYGLLGDIVVGLIGAVLGGWIVGLLGLGSATSGIIGSLIVAILGAVLFIYLLRMLGSSRV